MDLDLSWNYLEGSIGTSFYKHAKIDLGHNAFSGELLTLPNLRREPAPRFARARAAPRREFIFRARPEVL